MKRTLFSVIVAASLILGGCSSTSPTARKSKAPPPPPELVGGQSAAYMMFQAARQWSQDVQMYSMESIDLDSLRGKQGKFAAWRASFVSPSRGRIKTYAYSVIDAQGIRSGVSHEPDQPFMTRPQQTPFYIQAIKTDSPEALEAALTDKQIKDMADKNPDSPLFFQIEATAQSQMSPAWRVVWGPTIAQSTGS
ncbi:MAG: hypothetical protein C0506_17270, partial [Anaerolinea sp.]|nr:hypothetical protein [Anaerolinea sp.]